MYSELDTIKEATESVYTPLTTGLKNITGENGWLVISKMNFATYIKEKDPTQLLELEGAICPYNIVKEDNKPYFRCACGKKHIERLAIMEWNGSNYNYIIIGSSCIITIHKFLKKIDGIDNIILKLEEWIQTIKEEEKKTKNNQCVSCKKYKISKTTKYKKEQRKLWCNDCISSDRVKCITCKEFMFYEKDYYGKPKKYCRPCYFVPLTAP